MDRKRLALLLLSLWFMAVVAVFFLAGNRSAAVFAFLFTAVYGGVCYRYRDRIRSILASVPVSKALMFFIVAFAVTAAEETFCFLTGNRIALPVLWADILFCGLVWSGWFGTWYFYLSKTYRFGETEALLVAGLSGLLYEGAGPVLASPPSALPILLIAPFLSLVYSAIFLVPMQLIRFTGAKDSAWKYPVSVVLPFLVSVPITLALFIVFRVTGVMIT
ncbi:MAG TPA: hypothetical protein VLT35_03355 [Methanocella sp.]|nr:hypothetical protein [Methanocella sp.]